MSSLENTSSLFGKIVPFVLRVGLLLIQISSRPSSKRRVIFIRNTCEFALATVAYCMVENVFSVWTIFSSESTWRTKLEEKSVAGWSTVITATGLFTAMLSGRMHRIGYITIVFVIASFIDPITYFWVQPNETVMRKYDASLVQRSYKNMGGGAILHICAGFIALIAFVSVGRRRVHRRDLYDYSRVSRSATWATVCLLGYGVLIVGMVAMCMPDITDETSSLIDKYLDKILTNNLMAIAGGVTVVIAMRFSAEKSTLKFCKTLRCMKGGIAAMVMVSSGVDSFTPLTSFWIGALGGAFYYFVARELFRSPWEERDYSNMIPVHLVCGLISTLLLPIFGNPDSYVMGGNVIFGVVEQILWQMIYKLSLMVSLFIIFLPVFLLLHFFGMIEPKNEDLRGRRNARRISAGLAKLQATKPKKLQRTRNAAREKEAREERETIKVLREKQKACMRTITTNKV